jgi:hypothetical protein
MSDGISVHGGADGVDARYDDMERTAAVLATVAGRLEDVHRACFLATVLAGEAAGPFSGAPAGPDEVRAAAHAVGALAADVRGLGWLLRRAVQHYRHGDDDVLHRIGAAVGSAVGTMWHATTGIPGALVHGTEGLFRHGPAGALEQGLAADPALADAASALTPIMPISALTGNPLSDLLAFLRAYCTDGQPTVRAAGADTTGAAATPPRSLSDLMAALALRDRGRDGEIDVRILAGADGRRRVVVDIPGTKDWSIARTSTDVVGVAGNLRAIDGSATSYEAGVLEAMRRAGVRPDDDVMLVGHSLGGMVAVTAARDAVRSGAFRVTHVVTAGAPIGKFVGQLPRSVQVLALENRHDVVPHLDGTDNPDRVNVTTVSFTGPADSTGDAHGIDSAYQPGAQLADATNDRAVRDFLRSASGFLDAEGVHTERYVVSRGK